MWLWAIWGVQSPSAFQPGRKYYFSFQKTHPSAFTGTCKVIYWGVGIISEECYNTEDTKIIGLANSVFSSVSKEGLLKPKVSTRRLFLEESYIQTSNSFLEICAHPPRARSSHLSLWQLWFPEKISISPVTPSLAPFWIPRARRALLLAVPQKGSKLDKDRFRTTTSKHGYKFKFLFKLSNRDLFLY